MTQEAALDTILSSKHVVVLFGGDYSDNALSLDSETFTKNPQVFVDWVSTKVDKKQNPDPTHLLINELAELGILQRCYTLNLNKSEFEVGIPEELIKYVRGNYCSAHCMSCKTPQNMFRVNKEWKSKKLAKCKKCDSIIKPNVTFVGDTLSSDCISTLEADVKDCDCLLVFGPTLNVNVFQSILLSVSETIPRLFIGKNKFDFSVSLQDDITKITERLKQMEEEKTKLTNHLKKIQTDTSSRDVTVVMKSDKFSNALLELRSLNKLFN
jgi:NAD-dependent SIR2 family protein deacetylase